MRSCRRPRRWLSGWLVVMLLFTQLCTAAYACPSGVDAARIEVLVAEMPGCDGQMPRAMDPEQPQLCQAHCQQGSQAVHPTPTQDAPASLVLVAVLDWSPAARLPSQPVAQAPVVESGAAPPGSPPRYLSLLVLRN